MSESTSRFGHPAFLAFIFSPFYFWKLKYNWISHLQPHLRVVSRQKKERERGTTWEYFTLKQQCPHLERGSMQGVTQKNRNPFQVQNDVCPYKHRTPQQHKNSKLLDHPHNFQFQSHVFKGKVLWPIFKRWLKRPHICTKPLDNRAVVKANYLNDAICPQPKSSKT